MKIYNGQQTLKTNKFSTDFHKKVVDFIYWVHDLKQRRDTIIYTFCKQSQLVLIVRELKVELSCAKYDTVEIKVVNIDVGWGWNDWKERFSKIWGVQQVLMEYNVNKSSAGSSLKDGSQHATPIKTKIC